MSKFTFKKWYCEAIDPVVMKKALALTESLNKKDAFKVKEDRIIFKLELDGKWYFVKKNIPFRLKEKVKELFRVQSKFEYKAGSLLRELNIPVVKVIGWCRDNYKSIVVTEKPEHYVCNAKDFYLENVVSNKELKHRFFLTAAKFIKNFLEAKLIHPDFHLGNLLVKEKDNEISLILVDPFGIKQCKGEYSIYKSGLIHFLFGLKWELGREEKISFFNDSGLIKARSDFGVLWAGILRQAIKHEKKKWPGRKRKIVSRNTRFAARFKEQDGILFVRKDVKGNILIKPEEIYHFNEKKYMIIKGKRKRLKSRWLFSLFLQTIGIDHTKIVAWKQSFNNNDILIQEKRDESCFEENSQYLDDFVLICSLIGIKMYDFSKEIAFMNGLPFLKNSDPRYWGYII